MADTGEPVEIGNELLQAIETDFGYKVKTFKVTEETIPYLLKEGAIKEVATSEPKVPSMDIGYYINHIAERIGWKDENVARYLDKLVQINETAAFSIILKEVAVVLDQQYPDHIERSNEIYVISNITGEIVKVKDLTKIKNFRNFAAFRTLEDAICAKNIMKPIMKDLFKRGGK